MSCKACPAFHEGRILPRLTVRLADEGFWLNLPDTEEGMRVRPDRAIDRAGIPRDELPGQSREQNKWLVLRQVSPPAVRPANSLRKSLAEQTFRS